MAVIVPNAGDTTGGNKYQSLDQAEPDSVDLELLGNAGRTGVFSGCAVTTNGNSTTVNVASGVVVLAGTPYTVTGNASLGIPSAPADFRFDLVVARVSGGTASLFVIQGTNSSTNPTYPKSRSVITGAYDANTMWDPDTDVVLAALFRPGAGTVSAACIVDKRVMKTASVFNQGTGAPTGGAKGDLYYRAITPTGTSSGLYIKNVDGTWTELASNTLGSTGPYVPIGGMIAWPSTAAVPTGYLEANGSGQSTTTYSALFAVLGYTHGGSGGTFNLPNLNDKNLRGTTNTGQVGVTVGADTYTLSTAQLPSHAHDLQNHTHSMNGHTHGVDHSHTASSGFVTADHGHSFGTGTQSDNHYHTPIVGDFVRRHDSYIPGGNFFNVTDVGDNQGVQLSWNSQTSTESASHSHSGSTGGINTNHQHGITVNSTSGLATGGPSSGSTAGPSSNTTSGVGTGANISNIPASLQVRWIIRAL